MPTRFSDLKLGLQTAAATDLSLLGNLSMTTGKTLSVGGSTIVDATGKIPYSALSGTPSNVTWAQLQGVPSTLLYSDQNIALSATKTLSVGGSTIIDATGKIPYSALSGTPSSVTWAQLSGVPSTLLYSDQNVVLNAGKKITVGQTDIVDSSTKIDWSLLKNTPFLYSPSTLSTLPATADQSLGDFMFTWGQNVGQIQGMTGVNLANQNDGYLLLNTRATGDSVLMPRLRIDSAITTYGTVLPNANNTLDLGSSALRFKNAYLAGTLTSTGAVNSTAGFQVNGSSVVDSSGKLAYSAQKAVTFKAYHNPFSAGPYSTVVGAQILINGVTDYDINPLGVTGTQGFQVGTSTGTFPNGSTKKGYYFIPVAGSYIFTAKIRVPDGSNAIMAVSWRYAPNGGNPAYAANYNDVWIPGGDANGRRGLQTTQTFANLQVGDAVAPSTDFVSQYYTVEFCGYYIGS